METVTRDGVVAPGHQRRREARRRFTGQHHPGVDDHSRPLGVCPNELSTVEDGAWGCPSIVAYAALVARLPSSKYLVLSLIAWGGVALIWVASTHRTPFQMGLLLNLGTALFLLVAWYLFQMHVLEKVKAVGNEVRAIKASATSDVAGVRKEFATALQDLEARVHSQLAERGQSDAGILENLTKGTSAASARRMLERLSEVGAVSPEGVRVQIPTHGERLRFNIAQGDASGITVGLESESGNPIEQFDWPVDMPAEGIFIAIAQCLQINGLFTGLADADAAPLINGLVKIGRVGLRARTGLEGIPFTLGPIIEIPGDQWAITENGLESIGERRYSIERAQLYQLDWVDSLSTQSWVDLDELRYVRQVACALFDTK